MNVSVKVIFGQLRLYKMQPSFFISLSALFACLLLSACSQQQTYQPIIKTVIAVSPMPSEQFTKRTLSGVLHPVDQSELSFEMPGVLQTVNVNLGDRFEKGDILATIDNKVFELALKQRQGQLSEAKARLTQAQLDFNRKAKIVNTGAVSQAQVDAAKASYDSLIDQVDIAQTQVAIAQEDLADTVLVAPFSGSVAMRHVEPSQFVSRATPILTIQGSDALEVSVLVPESMISHINTGDAVLVDVTINRQLTQLLASVFERGKQAQRANAFPVTIALPTDNNTSYLQAGMSAEVTFTSRAMTSVQNSVTAPLSSVGAGPNNSHYVLALVPKNVLQAQKNNGDENIGNNSGNNSTQSNNTSNHTISNTSDNNSEWIVKKVAVQVHAFTTQSAVFTPQSPITQIVATGIDFLHEEQSVHIADDFPKTINP